MGERFSHCERIKRQNTGSRHSCNVAGVFALLGRKHLDRKFSPIDEPVTPEASDTRCDESSGRVNLTDLAPLGNGYLHADLRGGDQVLLYNRIDPVPSSMTVCSKEDPIRQSELAEGFTLLHTSRNCDKSNVWIRPCGVSGRNSSLGLTDVRAFGSDQSRKVGRVDCLIVNENQFPYSKSRKLLDEDAADAAQSDNCDTHPRQRFLPPITKKSSLPIP